MPLGRGAVPLASRCAAKSLGTASHEVWSSVRRPLVTTMRSFQKKLCNASARVFTMDSVIVGPCCDMKAGVTPLACRAGSGSLA